jgi:hypothetical protein
VPDQRLARNPTYQNATPEQQASLRKGVVAADFTESMVLLVLGAPDSRDFKETATLFDGRWIYDGSNPQATRSTPPLVASTQGRRTWHPSGFTTPSSDSSVATPRPRGVDDAIPPGAATNGFELQHDPTRHSQPYVSDARASLQSSSFSTQYTTIVTFRAGKVVSVQELRRKPSGS